MTDFGSTEMEMLWLSVVLGLVQLLVATFLSVTTRGMPWGVSARDAGAPPMGLRGARIERAYRNFLETFPFFAAAVLIVQVLNKHTPSTAIGAQVYFWSRLIYVPAYALGVPYLRTIVWVTSLIGIGMVMRGVWPGM
jgi:uncharacterized MAPEG superfamily protein